MLSERTSRPPNPETARVFFALWPPEEIARQLGGIAAEFAKQAGGRPTRRETIHLTLAFLGDIAVESLPELQRVASELRFAAFDLKLDRFGLWKHNRLLWAGCGSPQLIDLANVLQKRLLEAGFSVADAKRPFAPHLTLVRKVARLETALPVAEPLTWRCDSFALVRSQLSPAGSAYRVLAEFPPTETFKA